MCATQGVNVMLHVQLSSKFRIFSCMSEDCFSCMTVSYKQLLSITIKILKKQTNRQKNCKKHEKMQVPVFPLIGCLFSSGSPEGCAGDGSEFLWPASHLHLQPGCVGCRTLSEMEKPWSQPGKHDVKCVGLYEQGKTGFLLE